MNYQKIHDQIIERAQLEDRKKNQSVYYESHHIIPKCMGGTNSKNNLVLLTAREHFLIHWLLYRIHPTNHKLAFAFHLCCLVNNKLSQKQFTPSSRSYAEAAEAKSVALKAREPWNKNLKTGPNPKMAESKKGTEPWNKNKKGLQEAWNVGLKIGPHSQVSNENRSKTLKERYKSMDHPRKNVIPWNKGLKGAQVAWNKGLTK
jgi:hypothetical protein